MRKGKDQMREDLLKTFPEEKKAIDQYFILVRDARAAAKYFFLFKLLPKWVGSLFGGFFTSTFHQWNQKTTCATSIY